MGGIPSTEDVAVGADAPEVHLAQDVIDSIFLHDDIESDEELVAGVGFVHTASDDVDMLFGSREPSSAPSSQRTDEPEDISAPISMNQSTGLVTHALLRHGPHSVR